VSPLTGLPPATGVTGTGRQELGQAGSYDALIDLVAMSISTALETKRERILERMFEFRNPLLVTTEDDQKQFFLGYFNVVAAAAAGNDAVREEYLQAVVPGIKLAGMPLPMVMDGMVRVAMVLAAEVDAEHMAWMVAFNADYTSRLTELWEA
jgi:hypothetical protein